jgi:hypothetical protein
VRPHHHNPGLDQIAGKPKAARYRLLRICCKLDTVATKNSLADLRGGCYRLSGSPLTCPAAPKSRTYQEGEVSHEKMRARTRLLQALHSKDPEAIRQARADAIKAGYSNAAVGAIGRTHRLTCFSSASYRRPTSRRSCARPIRMSSSGISGTPT